MSGNRPDSGKAAAEAEDAAEVADDARSAAEEAAEEAEGSAADARGSAAAVQRHRLTSEERSKDFLEDLSREEGEDPFGAPGQPLKRHSPFYIGFFGAVGALLAIWLGQQILSISSVLVLIVVAMFLAIGLNPLVEALLRRGLARAWAVLVVTVAVLISVALFFVAIVPVISDQISTIVDQVPEWFDQLRNNQLVQELNRKYGLIDRAQGMIESGGWTERIFGGVVGIGMAVLSALLNTFIIVVLTLYFLASLPSIKRAGYRLAPASRRERVTYLGDQILRNIGGYVSGAFLVALAAGVSSLIFLFIVGLGEYAVALAFVVAVLDVIPMIGATLGAIVVTSIGFATDVRTGIACLVFYLVYQQFENYFIYPRVMSRSVDIPGSLIVIAALIGATLLGVVGALLAIPTAAAMLLILREVFLRRQDAR